MARPGGVKGTLRYVYRDSDSILLKLYGAAFLAASTFLTVLWVLALITWLGRLADAPPTGRIWGFIPFLVVVYLAVETVLFLPLYVPARLASSREGAPGDYEPL